MMDWKEKMAEGMRIMAEACADNPNWNDCHKCPFDDICSIINYDIIKDEKEFCSMSELFNNALDNYEKE